MLEKMDMVTVGIDINSDAMESQVNVYAKNGSGFKLVNTIYGKDAENIYAVLIGEKKYGEQ